MAQYKNGRSQKSKAMSFEQNIFINCPFDAQYLPLLKAKIYVLKRTGLNPRISLERSNSGEVRLKKIQELIESSKYSIHDLSRAKAKKAKEYFRLNMPFELGVDLGCRDYNSDVKYKKKVILIFEEEKYSVQKSLSDLSFADCKCHKGDTAELVIELRNWLSEIGFKNIPSGSSLWDEYNFFHADMYQSMLNSGFKQNDIERLPIVEFMNKVDEHLLAIKN